MRMFRLSVAFVAIFLLLGTIPLLAADDTANHSVAKVTDHAKIFTPEAVEQANKVIEQIREAHHKDLVIETFASLPEDLKDEYSPENAAQFFQKWMNQRARELKVNGVYVLISIAPNYVEVGVGQDTRKKAFTIDDRDALADILIKALKEKGFDDGLLQGVDFVKKTMGANLGAAKGAPEEKPGAGNDKAGDEYAPTTRPATQPAAGENHS